MHVFVCVCVCVCVCVSSLQLLTNGTMSKAVDVYSFGVLLWQMYTGSRPWSGLTHAQIILKVKPWPSTAPPCPTHVYRCPFCATDTPVWLRFCGDRTLHRCWGY